LPHPRGLNFYIVIYREMLKKCYSQELLHQIGQYLAWSFPGTRRFKFVQMKSLGSQMALPGGLNFYIVIYRELLKKIFSRTTRPISTKLGRKHAWEMGIQICSNKGLAPFGAQ